MRFWDMSDGRHGPRIPTIFHFLTLTVTLCRVSDMVDMVPAFIGLKKEASALDWIEIECCWGSLELV